MHSPVSRPATPARLAPLGLILLLALPFPLGAAQSEGATLTFTTGFTGNRVGAL